jgi:hypothetical protein
LTPLRGADFLVLSPPVTTPAEPPSGAYLLAGGLRARGYSAPLLDLSLEFYERVLGSAPGTDVQRALGYLRSAVDGFDPSRHRTAVGILHSALKSAQQDLSGWKLTLMDFTPPCDPHNPEAILRLCESGGSPLDQFWEEALEGRLDDLRPGKVLVSVAYLSQLAAAVDLCLFLRKKGVDYCTGGSLLNSLGLTGRGSHLLERALGPVMRGDGSELAKEPPGEFLRRIVAPENLSASPYYSPSPVVPFTLSSGCCWSKCLFCPDRGVLFRSWGEDSLSRFLSSVPSPPGMRNVLHLLDSALPPGLLADALPAIRSSGVDFFGFARPSRALLEACPPEELACSGCLMLQLGAESGSDRILERYAKGFTATESTEVVEALASAGVRTYLYLLFGLPCETDEDRESTVAMIEGLGSSVDFLNLSLFNLPRSSALAQRAGEFGVTLLPDSEREEPDRIALYTEFMVGGRIPRREARLFLSRVASRRPEFRRAMTNTPKWLRAAHPAQMLIPGRRPPGRDAHGIREG